MSIYDLEPIDLERIHTYDLAARPSKINVADFSSPIDAGDSLQAFLGKLPNVLAVQSLRCVAGEIHLAINLGMPIIWGLVGQVVKSGFVPILIQFLSIGLDVTIW